MLVNKMLFAALATAAFSASGHGTSHVQAAGGRDGDEIVVTGVRLRATKVDYRLRGARIVYCGPRDNQQDARSVVSICDFLERCAYRGARSRSALSDCVEAKIAAREHGRR